MGNETPKKKIPVGLIAGIAAAALAASLVGGYLGLCGWVKDNGRLLPGAAARDDKGTEVDLGKLSREDALAAVSEKMDRQLDSRTLTLHYGDGKQAQFAGELMACSPEGTVDAGFSAKENTPFLKLGALWLGLARESADLPLSAAALTPEGEARAKEIIQSIVDEVYVAPVDFTYELGEENVVVTPGTDGQRMDADALFAAVKAALTQGAAELTAEPEVVPGAELSGEVLHDLVHVEPQAAGVDADGKLTPAVIGRSVNTEEAQALLDAAEPGQPVTIPLEYTPPETPVDESMYYTDLLASVTTNMDGVANRSFNVMRAASFCNGKVLQPGEVFSYIGTIGDPSIANGYKPSTGYQGGLTVSMEGGGVCQISSCLYYCAVYANLEIVNRACHAFATGYIPNGLDATIYYPSLDFKFRNNTGFPIKIVAYAEGGDAGTVTVQFYGSNPDNISVKTERYTTSVTGWTTVYRPDENIPQGTTKVDVTPYTGYTVDVYRCVYDADDNLISRTYENHSRYAKRDKVILYNPLDEGPWGPAVEPTDPGVEPTDPGVVPTDPGVVPTDPGVVPTDPGVEPTDPGVEPTDPGVEPTDPGVGPVEPGVEPAPDPAVTPDPAEPEATRFVDPLVPWE